MTKLVIARAILEDTLARLQTGGALGQERMIAWLGRDTPTGGGKVRELYEPEQMCKKDQFYLPPSSMRALMQTLAQKRSKILAQIHTHPGRAFHSEADDAWAIIRHRGALSLVLPYFAESTTIETFLADVVTYECSADGRWDLVPSTCLAIAP